MHTPTQCSSAPRNRVLILAYSWLLFDPPIINLGKLVSSRKNEVLALAIPRESALAREEVQPGFVISRGNNFFHRPWLHFLGPVIYIARALLALIKFKPDVIVATNWNSFLVASLANLLGFRRILYYQLEYNDREPHLLRRQSVWARLALSLEKRIASRSKKIYSAEPHRSELMRADYGLSFTPPHIYNSPPLALSSNRPPPLERSGPLRFVFAGSISSVACIDTLLAALSLTKVDATFDIYGMVADSFAKEFETGLLRARAAGNIVRYCGIVPYTVLREKMSAYEVGIIFYQPRDKNTLFCSPCKLFEYLACGLAILGAKLPSIERIVAPGLGKCVNPDSSDEILHAINFFVQNANRLCLIRRAAFEAFRTKYGYELQAQELLKDIEA